MRVRIVGVAFVRALAGARSGAMGDRDVSELDRQVVAFDLSIDRSRETLNHRSNVTWYTIWPSFLVVPR